MTSYRKVITKLYCKLLGEEFKIRFKEKQILQNQIGYESYEKEVDLLSETTVGQILKGKRNISFNASLAFQTSLDYKHPRDLFFPNKKFELLLIKNIITTILTDPVFEDTLLNQLLVKKFLISHKKKYLNSLKKTKKFFYVLCQTLFQIFQRKKLRIK